MFPSEYRSIKDRLLDHLRMVKEPIPRERLLEDLNITSTQLHTAIRVLRASGHCVIDDTTKPTPHYYIREHSSTRNRT